MSKGEAKGHNLQIDDKSIDQFLALAKGHKDGVKVRFGADHDAGADDINGILKEFRKENGKVVADLHLLKSDKNYEKLIEMAEKLPNEFGLSASTAAEEELIGHDKYVRFNEIYCVDIVSNPAATKGLFFSQQTKTNKPSMKNIALALGLPENATEEQIIQASKLALEAKCKMESEAKEKKEKEEADDEEKGKDKKKFEALEKQVLELSAHFKAQNDKAAADAATAKESAHKATIENLKLEAGKEGKVINLSDSALLKLSEQEVKEYIAALPKNQLKLSAGNKPSGESKAVDKRSPEFKAQLAEIKAKNALLLGQKMLQK